MRGFVPDRAYVGGVGLALILGACAHVAPAPVTHAPDAELARLRGELAQREQLITQLEGRLALAEAGQRQLRDELERAYEARNEAPAQREGQRESVRIGRARPGPEPAHEIAEPEPARPMLRLHSDRPRAYAHADSELTSTWTPPATSERLRVVPLPDVPAKPAQTTAAAPTAAPQSDDLYLRALDLLRRHEFAEAQRELDAFVAARPSDPRVGKAHFFRAELYYAERDYARALVAYQQSLARDASGDKAPDAMLRSALCQLALGARDQARATLQALRAKFPDSEAAHKSAQVMQENSG
jgi:tol-pal system protein YbgF